MSAFGRNLGDVGALFSACRFTVAGLLVTSTAFAAPSSVVELVLDVPFATAIVGEPVDCALRIRGPRIDEKIFDGHPEYTAVNPGPPEDGFVYRFRFVPSAVGTHTIGPFFFGIDAFRLRSNTVEVVVHPKPAAGAIRAVPARATVPLGQRLAIRVDHPGGTLPALRLRPSAAYDVVSTSKGAGAVLFVLVPKRVGTILLAPEMFEGLAKTTPFWTVPVEVAPVKEEGPPLPGPPRPGEEVQETGVPIETS